MHHHPKADHAPRRAAAAAAMPPRARAAARLTLPLVLVIVVGLYALARRPFSWYAALGPVERGVAGPAPRATVPLEAHIISKCPDTRVWTPPCPTP